MKLKDGLIVSEMDGEYVGVGFGEAGKSFGGMMRMNKTAAVIVERLQSEATEEQLVKALTDRFEVDEAVALENVRKIVDQLKDAGVIEQ